MERQATLQILVWQPTPTEFLVKETAKKNEVGSTRRDETLSAVAVPTLCDDGDGEKKPCRLAIIGVTVQRTTEMSLIDPLAGT